MAGRSANLTSTDAIAAMRASLIVFEEGIHEALTMLELEVRRPVDWIENDRGHYWPREVNKASDRLSEARISLERCELTISEDTRKSCIDEKKAFERAKRRLRTSEAKVIAVRKWKVQIAKEVEEFKVALSKVKRYLETDFLVTKGALEKIASSIERYLDRAGAPGFSGGNTAPVNSSSEATSSLAASDVSAEPSSGNTEPSP